VVLTGGSSGIGRAAALAFAARGDRLVLSARGRPDLESVAGRCRAAGAEAVVVPADVSQADQVAKVAEVAVDRFGRIDVWVDSAAVMAYGRFEDLPAHVFDQTVTTDVLGTANVARVALRQFRRQGAGTLVLCGSLLGGITAPYMSAYVTSKWAHRGLVRVLQHETRDAKDIHVCLVSPGSVDTPIYTSAANYAGFVGRPPPPVDPPERTAAAIVRVTDHPRAKVSVGLTNNVIRFGYAALPPVYDLLIGPMMRRLALSRTPADPGPGNVFESRPRVEGGPGRWGRAAVVGAGSTAAALAAGAATLALRRTRR
jgi:short-subunit dehydrogenase